MQEMMANGLKVKICVSTRKPKILKGQSSTTVLSFRIPLQLAKRIDTSTSIALGFFDHETKEINRSKIVPVQRAKCRIVTVTTKENIPTQIPGINTEGNNDPEVYVKYKQ